MIRFLNVGLAASKDCLPTPRSEFLGILPHYTFSVALKKPLTSVRIELVTTDTKPSTLPHGATKEIRVVLASSRRC